MKRKDAVEVNSQYDGLIPFFSLSVRTQIALEEQFEKKENKCYARWITGIITRIRRLSTGPKPLKEIQRVVRERYCGPLSISVRLMFFENPGKSQVIFRLFGGKLSNWRKVGVTSPYILFLFFFSFAPRSVPVCSPITGVLSPFSSLMTRHTEFPGGLSHLGLQSPI